MSASVSIEAETWCRVIPVVHTSRNVGSWRPALVLCVAAWLVALVAVGIGTGQQVGAQSDRSTVLVAEIDGVITPVMAAYVHDARVKAERDGYDVLLLRMDTPGGLETSMRDIVQELLASTVPVVVYVGPAGARATSAGAYIALAAHLTVMAPATSIGAATPISGDGSDLEAKATNDAAAYAQSLAELRGRDVEFAVDMVRSARSISAEEALRIGVADLLADSTASALEQLDGRRVQVGSPAVEVVVRTSGAALETMDMGAFRRVQQLLADPNLVFLFLSLTTLGVVYELATPGLGGGALVAAITGVLGMVGLSVLPVNAVGVVFFLIGAALVVAELFAPGVGIAAVGAAVMFVLGGLFLFDEAPGIEVSLAAVVPVAVATAVLSLGAGRIAQRSRSAPSVLTGVGVVLGHTVTVHAAPQGAQAFVAGSWWRVRSTGGELADGQQARVSAVDGLDLLVEPIAPGPPHVVPESATPEESP